MQKENDIRNKVLEKIRAGRVSMRPHAYFVLRGALATVVATLALAAAFFAFSFIFFSIHESGERFLLEFGQHGLTTFSLLFPWTFLAAFIAFAILAEWLIRRYTSAYRFPTLRILLWVIIAGVAGGTALNLTPLHASLLSAADHDALPLIGGFYEELHDPHQEQGVYRGTVASVTDGGFVITHDDRDRDSDDGVWAVVAPPDFDLGSLTSGDRLYVGGRLMNGVVYAYGVHRLSDDE